MKSALVTLITTKETSNSMHSKTDKEKDGLKLKLNFFNSLTTLKPPLRLRSLKLKKMRSTLTLPLLTSNWNSSKRSKSTKKISSPLKRKSLISSLPLLPLKLMSINATLKKSLLKVNLLLLSRNLLMRLKNTRKRTTISLKKSLFSKKLLDSMMTLLLIKKKPSRTELMTTLTIKTSMKTNTTTVKSPRLISSTVQLD